MDTSTTPPFTTPPPETDLIKAQSSSSLSLTEILRQFRAAPTSPEELEAALAPHLENPPAEPPKELFGPLFDLILHHPNSIEILSTCVHLLANLIHNAPSCASLVAERKGVQLLFHTLILHKEAHRINLHAIRALCVIITEVPHIASSVYQFFGVEVIVASAKTFLEDVELQRNALLCLIALASGDDEDDDVAAARRAGHARAALRVLRRFRKDGLLTCLACELMTYVVKYADGETLEQLGQIGTVRILASAIVMFKDDLDIIGRCSAALCVLARGDEECAVQLAELRGIELVLRSMKRFRGCRRLQVWNVLLLRAMADLDDSQAILFFNAGGLETILSCMIEYRMCVEIQEHSIWLVDRLAWLREEMRLKIISLGGVRTISGSLKVHILNEALVEKGVKTLKRIGSKP